MRRGRLAGVLAALALVPGLLATTAAGAAPGGAPDPNPATDRVSGQAAIDRLGSMLPTVALESGLSVAEMRSHLLSDESLYVDGTGRLLYVDPAPTVSAAASAVTPFDPTVTSADAFLLHSRPGASRVVYLDFDGHQLSGTAWNTSTGGDCWAEPYNVDTDPSTFTATERTTVISVWRRVAEDYAAFDVDVTTEDPGDAAINRASTSDTLFGTRLLVTKSTQNCPNGKTLYASVCANGCGGVAYVGVYDSTGSTHDYYQPALVFQNGVSSMKNIAEAASHEVGHNIGLNHDGTATLGYYRGHGAWAPIMGVGYDRPVVQWSRGEYSGANNSQDDFVVAGTNGLPLRADDHGNTTAAATALAGPSATIEGVIGTRTDVDAFTIAAGAGTATFTATPVPTSPNLDIRLEVRDGAGTLVASADPAVVATNVDTATGLGATITTTLAAGTYTVLVDGVGYGDPLSTGYSDYASVGNYRLSATVVGPDGAPPTAVATASTTSGTAPVTVSFTGSGSTDPEGGDLTYAWEFGDGGTSTEADPTYTYTAPGTYTARLTVTDPTGQTAAATVTVAVAVPVVRLDIASVTVAGTRSKAGVSATATVTVRDADGKAVSGVSVTGQWSIGTKVAATKSATTNTNGVAGVSSGNLKAAAGSVVTFCVTNLTKTGTLWEKALLTPSNGTDCASFTVV